MTTASRKSRGPLLVVMVTMWSVGAATAYVVGWLMMSTGHDDWRWMLASSAVPAALILLLRFGTPESPRWLMNQGRTDEAKQVVRQMLGKDAELSDLEEEAQTVTRYGDIFRGVYRKRTVFVSVFWACQLLPIYAITTYEPTISQCLQAIYQSELFPTSVRATATATANGFATGASRIGAAIGTWGAPVVLDHSTRLAMFLGTLVCGIGWLVSHRLAPETRGKTLAEASGARPEPPSPSPSPSSPTVAKEPS
ncbi:MFS transporter [Streptomyces sp. NPDC047315]|uniref:MFS transporter n=1 Tax=Streptomyces sp. NPDC047315 TaxID=3155142 RepID=UPI0033C58531